MCIRDRFKLGQNRKNYVPATNNLLTIYYYNRNGPQADSNATHISLLPGTRYILIICTHVLITHVLLISYTRNTWPGNLWPTWSTRPVCSLCSTSLPAPFRAVSAWYSHSRDEPNSSGTFVPSKLTRRRNKINETPNSLYKPQNILERFPISNNLLNFIPGIIYRLQRPLNIRKPRSPVQVLGLKLGRTVCTNAIQQCTNVPTFFSNGPSRIRYPGACSWNESI